MLDLLFVVSLWDGKYWTRIRYRVKYENDLSKTFEQPSKKKKSILFYLWFWKTVYNIIDVLRCTV